MSFLMRLIKNTLRKKKCFKSYHLNFAKECKAGLMTKNQLYIIWLEWRTKPHDHLSKHRKSIWHNSTTLHHKSTQQTRHRRELPQPDKWHLQKTVLEVLVWAVEQEKNKRQADWKERSKTIPTDDRSYIRANRQFSKVAGYNISTQNCVSIL